LLGLIVGIVGIVAAVAGLVIARRVTGRRADVDVESFIANLARIDPDAPPVDEEVVALPPSRPAEPVRIHRSTAAAS